MAHVRYVKLKHARSSLAERYPYLQKEPMYASNKKIDWISLSIWFQETGMKAKGLVSVSCAKRERET